MDIGNGIFAIMFPEDGHGPQHKVGKKEVIKKITIKSIYIVKNIKVTALVPMKGNSERVPNKNIRLLNGKPVCHWILESLSRSKYVDEIIINTDSDKIKEIVSDFKLVKVLDRPDFLLGDAVSMQPLIAHDIEYAKNDIIFKHILLTLY